MGTILSGTVSHHYNTSEVRPSKLRGKAAGVIIPQVELMCRESDPREIYNLAFCFSKSRRRIGTIESIHGDPPRTNSVKASGWSPSWYEERYRRMMPLCLLISRQSFSNDLCASAKTGTLTVTYGVGIGAGSTDAHVHPTASMLPACNAAANEAAVVGPGRSNWLGCGRAVLDWVDFMLPISADLVTGV